MFRLLKLLLSLAVLAATLFGVVPGEPVKSAVDLTDAGGDETDDNGHSQVVDNILKLDAALGETTKILQLFQGDMATASKVIQGVLNLHSISMASAEDAKTLPSLTLDQSRHIVQTLRTTLAVDIPAAIQLMVVKKPEFDALHLGPVIFTLLGLLQYDHDLFSILAGKKLYPVEIVSALLLVGRISAAIAAGEAAYAPLKPPGGPSTGESDSIPPITDFLLRGAPPGAFVAVTA